MVQALAPYGAHQSLGVRILPRRSRGCQNFLHPHVPNSWTKRIPIDRIAVMQEVAGNTVPGEGLGYLLCRPFRGGMRGNVEMKYPPPMVSQSDKYEQNSKTESGDHEKIGRDQILHMIVEKGAPCLRERFRQAN